MVNVSTLYSSSRYYTLTGACWLPELSTQTLTSTQTLLWIILKGVLTQSLLARKLKLFPNRTHGLTKESVFYWRQVMLTQNRESWKANMSRIEGNLSNSDLWCMWQGIQALTDYKRNNTPLSTSNESILKVWHSFMIREMHEKRTIIPEPPFSDLSLTLLTSDVCSTLSRMNTYKAAGPDDIPDSVLKAWTTGLHKHYHCP